MRVSLNKQNLKKHLHRMAMRVFFQILFVQIYPPSERQLQELFRARS